MHKTLTDLRDTVQKELAGVSTLKELEELELSVFGRSQGRLTLILRSLKDLPLEEKKTFGKDSNQVKEELEKLLLQKREGITEELIKKDLETRSFDASFSRTSEDRGTLHPMTQMLHEVVDIFQTMGFEVFQGPEIDDDYNNFTSLNIPEDHPARDMQDTIFLESGHLLRTHTSAMQNRILKSQKPPIRAIIPGKVFRHEATDACHDFEFHQLEGIVVDTDISLSHLIFTLKLFLKALFKKDIPYRIRPGYFPFVEPGMELDMQCQVCEGKKCAACKHSGWIEVMPCGMIHPVVLREGGLDPDVYSGFAFGFGLTRLLMNKYKIDDIRTIHSTDPRVLKQFIS